MTFTKRFVAAVAVVGLGTLAACGSGSDTAGDGGGSGTATAGAVDKGAIDKDASLVAGWTVGTTTLDPHMQQSELVGFRFGLAAIYDRLFSVDAQGKVKGMLVDKWEYQDKGTTLVMNLREDVKFRDGSALDAKVVKANLDRARTLDSPVVKNRMAAVTSVEASGPYEVTLKLASPTPIVPYVLADMAGYIMHPDLFGKGDPAKETNGSGAYSVKSYTPGEKIVLQRDVQDYWDKDAANFATIEHRQIQDFQAFSNALAGGQIDIGQFQPNQVASLENRAGLKTVRVPHSVGVDLQFNHKMKPLDKLEVRQAINYAYDREAIVKAMYPGSTAKYQYYRKGLAGYDPALEGAYSYDPAKAKALLTKAGHPNGVDLGKVLVTAAVVPGVVDILKEQMGKAGITFSAQTVDPLQIFAQWAAGKDIAALQFANGGTNPISGAQENWYGPSRNPAGTDKAFDKLFAKANNNQLSDADALKAEQAMNRYVVEQAWRAPLVWIDYPWVMNEKVQGFSAEADYATTTGPYDFRYLSKTK